MTSSFREALDSGKFVITSEIAPPKGTNLEKTVGSYNKAVRSMESRVIVTAKKMDELGVQGKEPIGELPRVNVQPQGTVIRNVENDKLP